MNIKEIQNLIKFVAKSGTSEVKLEMDDIKITIKTGGYERVEPTTIVQQVPSLSPTAPAALAPVSSAIPDVLATPAVVENDKFITIKSPIIGTFYRKPSPDKPTFVEVGQEINEGDVLCVVDAMKFFNEIESEVRGKIVKILVDESTPVEFDQPLFLVDPS